jgi:hypothetical protein
MLPPCGVIDEQSPHPLSGPDTTVLHCFTVAATAGRPAEMILRHLPQADGSYDDYLRVLGAHRIEEMLDGYGFGHGGSGWTRRECSSFAAAAAPIGLLDQLTQCSSPRSA